MDPLRRDAVQLVIDKAVAAGVDVPAEVSALARMDHAVNLGALLWVQANPDRKDEVFGCCWGDVNNGPDSCLCWWPVFEVDQATPVPLTCPEDIQVRPRACGDCAFRKDSPERADAWTEEALMNLPESGTPFWCHDGMRRPARWVHPDGRTVDGSPDDWRPPLLGTVPYRLDGRPGLLCAGWAARTGR